MNFFQLKSGDAHRHSAVNNSPLSISALNQQVARDWKNPSPCSGWLAKSQPDPGSVWPPVFFPQGQDAQVRCVMWRSRAQTLGWQPQDGAQVEARVLVSFYEPRGNFN